MQTGVLLSCYVPRVCHSCNFLPFPLFSSRSLVFRMVEAEEEYVDQLETLISLKRVRCRNMYIHALSGLANCPDPDDVVRMDREWPDTIFTEEQVASVAGDEEMAARLRLAQYCEQNLVNMGEILPPKVNDRWFRAILRRSSEAGVRKMQDD